MINQINYSLHTHTSDFDGHDMVENMVLAAKIRGIDTFGISNHFIFYPDIRKSEMYKFAKIGGYANIYNDNADELIARFQKNYQDIRDAQKKYPDMNILCGMEMDLFKNPHCIDVANKAVRILQPDYVIGSHHFLEWHDGYLMNIHDIKNKDSKTSGQMLRAYYQFYDDEFVDIINHELKFDIAFMAHVDLPRKLGMHNPMMEWYSVEKLSQIGMPLELNTSLIENKNYADANVEFAVLKAMAETKIPLVISDDAHGIADIKRSFDQMTEKAEKFGITTICTRAAELGKFIKFNTQNSR